MPGHGPQRAADARTAPTGADVHPPTVRTPVMHVINLLLLVAAAVCFAIAAAGIVTHRVNLIALGLLCWVMVGVIATARVVN
jgi:hypothetical protein